MGLVGVLDRSLFLKSGARSLRVSLLRLFDLALMFHRGRGGMAYWKWYIECGRDYV